MVAGKPEMHEPSLPSKYRVIRTIGSGGQGRVYLAHDLCRGNARVAVKVVRWAPGAVRETKRLEEEFLLLSRLAHPNIARVRDFGHLREGGAYFASDYILGENLLAWAAKKEPPERWKCLTSLAAEALYVLRYLALRGISHGDIKPANLLVERSRRGSEVSVRLKVIDFGAARLPGAQRGERWLLGTAPYLPPPEVLASARSDPREAERTDLWGLGMSLYHAGVGRLPFSLLDPAERRAWWAAGGGARPSEFDPHAPAALDSLIARLTMADPERCFRSAAEALDFLRRRAKLPDRLGVAKMHDTWTSSREHYVEGLVEATRGPAGARRVHAVVGPSGVGKTRALEVLAARLRTEGFQVFFFASPSDARPLSEIEEFLRASGSREGDGAGEPERLVARLRSREVAVLIDGISPVGSLPSPFPSELPFLRAWALSQSAGARGAAKSVTVAAGRDPAAIARALGISAEDLEVHPLETLRGEEIAELAREYFAVEAVPEDLVSRLEIETGGLPPKVLEALERLARAGVSADPFGRIELPENLPKRLLARRKGSGAQAAANMEAELKHALGLLKIAGEPVDPEGCARRFPLWSAEEWHGILEALRFRGFLHCEGARYRLAGSALSAELTELLEPKEIRRARMQLARYWREAPGASGPDAELAHARNELHLGNVESGGRAALRAARALARVGRDEEGMETLRAALESLRAGPTRSRPGGIRLELVLRLRAAELAVANQKAREALEILRAGARPAPPWFRRVAARLAARAYETLGNLKAAIRALKAFAQPGGRSPAGKTPPREDPFCWEAAALLAPLCFRSERLEEGRACLALGRKLLETEAERRMGQAPALWARALIAFARVESSHGEAEKARAFIEKAFALTSGLLRGEVPSSALNELGILLAQSQRFEAALRMFEGVEGRSRAAGDPVGAVKAIFNRAVIFYRLHDLDRAEECFREARRLSDSLGLRALSAALWIGHAALLRERGRNLEALRLYRSVLRLGEAVDPGDRIVVLNNLAELYLSLGSLRRAALHAAFAFRAARRIQDRFRIAFTLRLRGLVRCALGELSRARSDLKRAKAIASAEEDLRGEGIALYYLGLVESAAGNPRSALRLLRGAMRASYSAGDRKHHRAARTAALSQLLDLGRRSAARQILADAARSRTARAFERVLALRAALDWPKGFEEALEVAREAVLRGAVWEAFLALVSLSRDRLLKPQSRSELALEIASVSQRLVRRLSARRAARFVASWGIEEIARMKEPKTPPPAAGSSAEELSPPEKELAVLLEALRKDFSLRVVWIWEDPRAAPRLRTIAGDSRHVSSVLAEHSAALERAKGTGETVRSRPVVFAPLPGTRWMRILCAVATARGWASLSSAPDRFEDRRTAIALCARLAEAEEQLREERERHAKARSEIQQLHSAAAIDRHELETAIATQPVELVEVKRRQAAGAQPPPGYRRLIAESPSLRAIVSRLPLLAEKDLPVLLVGESGVGKDFLARVIHDLSPRRDHPFLAEICNVPESLMESELFGSTRGAFTGAVRDRPGLFQRAAGGTIYLDEISDLTPGMQARLLRVLEEKRVRPLGGEESVAVDFRLISSSRRKLQELEDPRLIRRDLLYRIKSEVVEIPPLRERPEDLKPLVEVIVEDFARRQAMPVPYIREDAFEKLANYHWPGNIRELENVLQRALVRRPAEVAPELLALGEPAAMAVGMPGARWAHAGLRAERRRWERSFVLEALRAHGGNATKAARALGVSRRYLTTLLGKHGVALSECKPASRPGRKSKPAAGKSPPRASSARGAPKTPKKG